MSKKQTIIKLPQQTRAELENMSEQFTAVEKALDSLKSLNMDVTAIERQLVTAKKQREILLRDF